MYPQTGANQFQNMSASKKVMFGFLLMIVLFVMTAATGFMTYTRAEKMLGLAVENSKKAKTDEKTAEETGRSRVDFDDVGRMLKTGKMMLIAISTMAVVLGLLMGFLISRSIGAAIKQFTADGAPDQARVSQADELLRQARELLANEERRQ